MITYRPTPNLSTGRTGFRAAIGAMMLAAVLGTTAFGPAGVTAAVPAGSTSTAVAIAATVPTQQAIIRRPDTSGLLDRDAADPMQA